MTDITTIWDFTTGRGDWGLSVPPAPSVDLLSGQDLGTAVLISLFSDATAGADEAIPDGTADPRGWWGDDGEAYPIGSKLWLLGRAKQTDASLSLAEDAITRALRWLVDDGVALKVDVACEWAAPGMLGATITVAQPAGASTFSWVWSAYGVNAPYVAPPPDPFILGSSILGGPDVI